MASTIAQAPPGALAFWADFTDAESLFADSARTSAAVDGGPLLGVADKSGNNRNLTGTAVTLVTDSSGTTAASFNGTSAHMVADAVATLISGNAQPFTLFLVVEPSPEALGTTRALFTAGAAANSTRYTQLDVTTSDTYLRRAGASQTIIPKVGRQTVGAKDYYIVRYTGALLRVIKNGFAQLANSGASTGDMTVDQFTLGANRKGGALNAFFSGRMYEAGVYASAIDDATIDSLDAYIRYKYLGETGKVAAIPVLGAGQSLMVGRATPYSSTPAVAPGTAYEVDYGSVTIGNTPIANPVGEDAKGSNTGGYVPQWCKAWYEATGQVVFFLQTAVGATGLQPRNDANGNWSTLYASDPGATKLADALRAKAAGLHAKLLASPRYSYVDQGVTILWDQWNNDGSGSLSESANAYALDGLFSRGGYTAELVALRDYVQNNNGGTPTPVKRFHAIQPGGHATTPSSEPNAVIIRAAQIDAMALIPNGFVPTTVPSTLTFGNYQGDETHYNASGNNAIGPDAAINGAAHRSLEVPLDTVVRVSLLKAPRSTEGGSNVTAKFLVLRHNSSAGACSVSWAVTGSGGNPASAADFVGGAFPSGTVSFADGERLKMISVPILGDAVSEATDESYTVALSSPVGCQLSAIASQIGTITDSGAPPPTLQALALDQNSGNNGVAWSSAVVNVTVGSVLTVVSVSSGETVDVSGATLSGTFASLPATITVRETLSGATGSPRDTVLTVNNAAAAVTLPTTALYANIDASQLSNLYQDSGGTTPVTAEGQTVALIADSSGNAHPITLSNGPVAYHIGTKKAVRFNGSSQYGVMSGGGALMNAATSAFTIHFAVYLNAGSGQNRSVVNCHHASGSSRRFVLVDTAADAQIIGTVDTAGAATNRTIATVPRRLQVDIWSWRRKSDGKMDVLRNGVQIATDVQDSVTSISASIVEIACRYAANTATRDSYLNGDIGQIVFYSAAQSDAEFNQAHTHMVQKWPG